MDSSNLKFCEKCNFPITCSCSVRTASNGQSCCDVCVSEYETLSAYISDVRDYFKEKHNKAEGLYCVTISSYEGTKDNMINKSIKHVYKSIDEFELKAFKQLIQINKNLAVDFQVCFYE
jgi:hypothetical protein